MLSASLYIIVCSAKNRLLVRLRRLREPRYLIGAIAGAAYFYFAVFRRMGASEEPARPAIRSRRRPCWPAYGGAAGFAGAGLLLLAALAWILPADSGLLAFSEAETNLLVPAPVTRRQLLVHRLLRSQLPLLFGAVDLVGVRAAWRPARGFGSASACSSCSSRRACTSRA